MKIFVLLSRFPYPLDKGDKLRAFNQIKELSKNHEIVLCAISDTPITQQSSDMLKKYCKHVEILRLSYSGILVNVLKSFFNGKPLQTGYFFQEKLKKQIQNLIASHQPDHIYCQLLRTAEYVKELNIPKTIDYMDALSMGMSRRISKGSLLLKPVLALEATRLKAFETEIFSAFNNKVIISDQDKFHILHPLNSDIQVIPNGVDIDFFKPGNNPEKDFDLVFTGNMNYPPNIESAEYLANDIFPLILKKIPDAKLLISGANPSKRVKALASDNIVVSGWVDDIRKSYSRSKIFIAPMRIGSGLQNKLLEAMAMKIPCITSDLANNALEAKPEEEILIGTDTADFADKAIELIRNEKFRVDLAEKAYKFVINKYNWERSTAILEKLITETVKTP
jgi:polysaccharide biosynthesis protein PslH